MLPETACSDRAFAWHGSGRRCSNIHLRRRRWRPRQVFIAVEFDLGLELVLGLSATTFFVCIVVAGGLRELDWLDILPQNVAFAATAG